MPPKKWKKHPKKLHTFGSWEVFFSGAPPALNSPELHFRFINFSIQPSLLESLYGTLSVRGCWGQPMLLFWKLVDELQIPKPQNYTDTFIITKKLLFVGLIGLRSISKPLETPCTIPSNYTTQFFQRVFTCFTSKMPETQLEFFGKNHNMHHMVVAYP